MLSWSHVPAHAYVGIYTTCMRVCMYIDGVSAGSCRILGAVYQYFNSRHKFTRQIACNTPEQRSFAEVIGYH
jgi:hypothetical protein